MSKTILAIGAHYDDCVFGVPGILLQAVRKNYRVVVLSVIGDYSNWKPVRNREQELLEGTVALGREHGVEMRFLGYASMQFDFEAEAKKKVAEAVAEIRPDVAFALWPDDSHTDHEVASRLSKLALRHGDRLLDPNTPYKSPSRIYYYDNGPRHTIGFEPNTFVDISDEWPQAIAWLGRLMALVRNAGYDAATLDGAQRTKEAIARYRGQTCGVQYAEALYATQAYPLDVL